MYLLKILLVVCTTSSSAAFSITHKPRNTLVFVPLMSDLTDEFPSDSSSEEIFDVESEEMEPTATEGILSSILETIPEGGLPVSTVSKDTRSYINEAIMKLEALNPTDTPSSSPLLNGVWTLRYSGGYDENCSLQSPTRQIALFLYSGGYSPGLFALSLASSLPSSLIDLGDLEISISREQPRIEASIDVKVLGGGENSVAVKSRLEVGSDIRISEVYESATILGQTVDIPDGIQYSRQLYIAYLDEEILVVRDGSGVPEILVRKK